MTERRILLVDGHGIAFRAFFALPEMTAPNGTHTNAAVGFFNMLGRAVTAHQPDRVVVAFDMKGPTFRHELFADYKANRPATPPEFSEQMPIIHQLLASAGIDVMESAGLEADDLIGAAACQWSEDAQILILSSDKDILQVLGPGVTILRPAKGVSDVEIVTAESFAQEWGFPPRLMVDYLALVGDKVDNVPGVPSVGDKTAKRLLSSYGSIEGILEHADEQTPALRKKLGEFGAQALETRKLTKLRCDVDMTQFENQSAQPDEKSFNAVLDGLAINHRLARPFFPTQAASEGQGADEPQVDDVETIVLYPEPAEEVPLTTLIGAPRLAVDVSDDGETASVCAPGGQWWSGPLAELKGESGVLSRRKVYCSDLKRLFGLTGLSGSWDLKTAHYLLHPDLTAHGLPDLADGLPFGPERTLRLFPLAEDLNEKIESYGMTDLMKTVDLPLLPALVRMEQAGVHLDGPAMAAFTAQLEASLDRVSGEILTYAGGPINLNSPKQVGELLFEKLGLPIIKRTAQKGYSTDVSVLETLCRSVGDICPVPALLLEHRELSKMLSGFAVPLAAASRDGVVHSTFEAQTTGTGRLSSRDPNLQNLPNYSELGGQLCRCLTAGPGGVFVAADYSQIELRVLAHLSGERRLREIFEAGRDIHTETAAMILGIPADSVTKEQRRMAKTVTFGLLYGMSAFGLADRLSVGQAEARGIMDAYFAALPGVREYVDATVAEARRRGYSQTAYGRIRPLDEVATGRQTDRGHARRVAINSPVQGTAADITKMAMITVDRELAAAGVPMVLQVHDSIVCRTTPENAEPVGKKLAEFMTGAVKLSVPLAVETKTGKTLADV